MTEFYKNTYPTSADNISAGYPLGSFWNNMVSYDVYEHMADGEWYWRKQDGVLANVEIPEQLNKTSPIPELDLMISGLTNRVTILEDNAFDVLYLDYWGDDATLPTPTKSGMYAITYQTGEVNPLAVSKVYISDENLDWLELIGYLTDDKSLNRVYIDRTTNQQYAWSGTVMTSMTAGSEIPILTDYPLKDPTKVGQRFWYQGYEWHYLSQPEIDALGWPETAGFPAPIYKVKNSHVYYEGFIFNSFGSPVSNNGDFTINILGSFFNQAKIAAFSIDTRNLPNNLIKIRNAHLLVGLEDKGTSISVDANACKLTTEALNDFFEQLPITVKVASIDIRNNSGTATCNTNIATTKGYIVIT